MSDVYSINEGMDNEILFIYEQNRFLDIHKKEKLVRMHTYEMLEFLTESDFLEQMGFKLENIKKEKSNS